MTFDDRLATVLAFPAGTVHDRAVRWRQLVDLVARAGPNAQGANVARALAEIRAGRSDIARPLRASAARAIAGRPLATGLIEAFAGDELEVAAPLLTGVTPTDELRAAASPEVRRFLDALHGAAVPARLVEPPRDIEPPRAAEPSPPPLMGAVPTIDEVVAKIEQLRLARENSGNGDAEPLPPAPEPEPIVEATPEPAAEQPAEPAAPAPEAPPRRKQAAQPIAAAPSALFRWECGASGTIGWVEGAPRGALIGRSIARAEREGVDGEVERAFARRAPFRDATLTLPQPGSVAGRWLISGVPAFAPTDGRFVGYRGVARRAGALEPAELPAAPAQLDEAALRELVHEIKTPLNAIIGFGEIIEGQYLGPAHSGYRARATEIVAQAGRLLAAIDDLDLAARLRARGEETATELAAWFAPLAARLQAEAQERGLVLAIESPPAEARCGLDGQLAERLAERFAHAVLGAAQPGEALRLAVRGDGGQCALRLTRPRLFEGLDPGALYEIEPAGFSLRLVKGLAQIVGGGLLLDGGELVLSLPAA